MVKSLGVGGQTQAERELGWNRGAIRKGMEELTSGIPIKVHLSVEDVSG